SGGVPAIADVDLDGRNELVVMSDAWNGQQGFYDKVWAYDLHGSTYGGIEWGQFGGDPEHTNCYPCGTGPPPPPPPPPQPPPPPPPPARRCVVPRVVRMKLGRARARIRRVHCSVGHISKRHSRRVGRVLSQRPRAGTHLRLGGKIRLVVGRR